MNKFDDGTLEILSIQDVKGELMFDDIAEEEVMKVRVKYINGLSGILPMMDDRVQEFISKYETEEFLKSSKTVVTASSKHKKTHKKDKDGKGKKRSHHIKKKQHNNSSSSSDNEEGPLKKKTKPNEKELSVQLPILKTIVPIDNRKSLIVEKTTITTKLQQLPTSQSIKELKSKTDPSDLKHTTSLRAEQKPLPQSKPKEEEKAPIINLVEEEKNDMDIDQTTTTLPPPITTTTLADNNNIDDAFEDNFSMFMFEPPVETITNNNNTESLVNPSSSLGIIDNTNIISQESSKSFQEGSKSFQEQDKPQQFNDFLKKGTPSAGAGNEVSQFFEHQQQQSASWDEINKQTEKYMELAAKDPLQPIARPHVEAQQQPVKEVIVVKYVDRLVELPEVQKRKADELKKSYNGMGTDLRKNSTTLSSLADIVKQNALKLTALSEMSSTDTEDIDYLRTSSKDIATHLNQYSNTMKSLETRTTQVAQSLNSSSPNISNIFSTKGSKSMEEISSSNSRNRLNEKTQSLSSLNEPNNNNDSKVVGEIDPKQFLQIARDEINNTFWQETIAMLKESEEKRQQSIKEVIQLKALLLNANRTTGPAPLQTPTGVVLRPNSTNIIRQFDQTIEDRFVAETQTFAEIITNALNDHVLKTQTIMDDHSSGLMNTITNTPNFFNYNYPPSVPVVAPPPLLNTTDSDRIDKLVKENKTMDDKSSSFINKWSKQFNQQQQQMLDE